MVPMTIKVQVPFEQVFPFGALCLGVEPQVDFDKRGKGGDDQARDKETGERVWVARVMDLDPEAAKPGRSTEVKVKIAAPVQPVPPASKVDGYPPSVEFEGLTLTPYVDSSRCAGSGPRCRGRQAFSIRATAMREPGAPAKPSRSAAA
jgi:hypothetical protein